jgi:hypothetical protein
MLLGLFDDLEQQAEGLALLERDAEVAELGRAEYAQVTLAARMHASIGRRVTLGVAGLEVLAGTLVRVGGDWCLMESDAGSYRPLGREWIVPFGAVMWAGGLSERGVDDVGRAVSARLSLGSAVRSVAAERALLRAHLRDGTVRSGRPGRVGADFLELIPNEGGVAGGEGGRAPLRQVVPFPALAGLRRV